MSNFSTIHILDENSQRRAEMSYILGQKDMSVQIYDSLCEFKQFTPNKGIVLFHDNTLLISSLEITNVLRHSGVALPIAAYAENPVPSNIVDAMISGAIDYLSWPLSPDALVLAIRRMSARAEASMERQRLEAGARVRITQLSEREKQVLTCMVEGFASKEIGQQLNISPRTVEIHRANVLRKVNARSTAEALRIAIYAGLDRPS